jgi:biopolymer transport protein ExbD
LLLLLFFILTSTFMVHTSIQIEVPKTQGTPKLEQRDVSITLQQGEGGPDNRGRVYVNNDEIASWGDLSQRLSNEVARQPDLLVLIRPDSRIETGRLVKVLGIATGVGVQHYGIAAVAPPGE